MEVPVKRIIWIGCNEWVEGKFKKKIDWIQAQPSQVVAVASQITILIKIIVALITIEVYNRNIVDSLNKAGCESAGDYLWQQHLRYYF